MSKQWPHQHYRAGVLYSLNTVYDLDHPRGTAERHVGKHCVYSGTLRFLWKETWAQSKRTTTCFSLDDSRKGAQQSIFAQQNRQHSESRINNFNQALSKSYRHLSLTLPGLPIFFTKEKTVSLPLTKTSFSVILQVSSHENIGDGSLASVHFIISLFQNKNCSYCLQSIYEWAESNSIDINLQIVMMPTLIFFKKALLLV